MSTSGGLSGPVLVIGLLAILGFALVIGLAVMGSRRDRQRVGDLSAWALSRDFSFTATSSTTHRLQVIVVNLPARWPTVSVTPKSLGSRIAVTFGGQDIEIGNRDFDRQFRVRCDDEAAARRLLLPMAPWLLAWTDQAFSSNGNVVVARRQEQLIAADLEPWLRDLGAALTGAGG